MIKKLTNLEINMSSSKWKHQKRNMMSKKKGKLKNTIVEILEKESVYTHGTRLPKAVKDISANWKEFLKENPTMKKKGKPTQHKRKHSTQTKQTANVEKDVKEVWFDDVDDMLIEKPLSVETSDENKHSSQAQASRESKDVNNQLVKEKSYSGVTKVVAMDCEMVGVGEDGKDSILARVSIVNQYGQCIYDKYVKPAEEVTDYRTFVSGIRPHDLRNGEEFSMVQSEVAKILKGRLLIGHAVMNDLKVLYLSHPKKKIRDTSRYRPFRQLSGGRTPGLKKLSSSVLGVEVQKGEHSSVQDAQAAMRLYTMKRKEWEKNIKIKLVGNRKSAAKNTS